MKKIAVIGSMDTKGMEYLYLIGKLKEYGAETISIDISTYGKPAFTPDITSDRIAMAGGRDFLHEENCELTKSEKLSVMAAGAVKTVCELQETGDIDGIIGMGGGQGTFMISEVMRALPIGFPKFLISTILNLPGATHRAFRDLGDTVLMNSVVDVSGDNAIILSVMDKAAGAIVGMANSESEKHFEAAPGRKKIGISMWGVTTPCVSRIRSQLEAQGYEVYAFHANGIAGAIIEKLVKQGFFDGMIEITLSEFVQDRVGVYNRPIPNRLDGPSVSAIPYILAPGGVDMVQMVRPFDNLPERYQDRQYFYHNENAMFVRSTGEECNYIGEEISKKLNAGITPVKVFLPLQGLSDADKEGGPLRNPENDEKLFEAIRKNFTNGEIVEVDAHLNSTEFADRIADAMNKILTK